MKLCGVGSYEKNTKPFHIVNIQDHEMEQHSEVDNCDHPVCEEVPLLQHDLTLAKSIEETLQKLPPSTASSIYQVSKRLRDINLKAYTPQIVSIGPFHHGRAHLKAMERHKLQALNIYLRRINMRTETAIGIARKWETQARNCYAEPITMNSDEFVKMMLVDGCFMVEFMMLENTEFHPTQNRLDCSFYEAMRNHLYHDFIMLENQLPLFVLRDLFDQVSLSDSGMENISFVKFIHKFFSNGFVKQCELPEPLREANHLVHFLSFYYFPTQRENNELEQGNFLLPPTLTELWEAGITIKKATKGRLLDISFKNGVLEIPPFEIDDHFETCIRNLMAFEHYRIRTSHMRVTNYIAFLDGLISTEKDASLLVKADILTNNIGGNNEEVSKLFNDLCKEVSLPCDYYYFNTTNALIKYCKAPHHRWMASLRRDYFNTPWALISFIAATFLILLTLIQTLYTFLPNSY